MITSVSITIFSFPIIKLAKYQRKYVSQYLYANVLDINIVTYLYPYIYRASYVPHARARL